MNREERVSELLKLRRLDFKFKQSNTTMGLHELIKKYVTSESSIVELGSFSGISSELFALHCKKLFCVDPWIPYWEINDSLKMSTAESQFDSMMKKYNNIIKYKLRSDEAYTKFKNYSLDMVYIDSDHSSQNVEKEIDLWYDKIKSTGYISGHDFNLPTVFNVVTKYFDPTFIEIFNDTSWIVPVNKKYEHFAK